MNYRNSEMKIDQLVNYLNEEKINLSPAFQRGHVWKQPARKKLIRNIVQGKPIPAVFLYKEAIGSKYSYNILDGKQRLESIILFIGTEHTDVRIKNLDKYFFPKELRKHAGFKVAATDRDVSFSEMSDTVVRDFREYSIPTIEISLDDNSSLDEVISLFVDINQQGEEVKRFDIVKAMYRSDPLLKSVFDLIAVEEKRGQDVFYKSKNNEFTSVLKSLQVVDAITATNSRIDKMWEKLLEIALFVRTNKHRKPMEILREFIATKRIETDKLKGDEIAKLRKTFKFVRSLSHRLRQSRIFTDQTHSYTLITSLIGSDLMDRFNLSALAEKIVKFERLLSQSSKIKDAAVRDMVASYKENAARQTTDISRRQERDRQFRQIVEIL